MTMYMLQLGETEIANIVNGISMISEIWRTVYDDCKQVESYLRITKKVSGQYQDDPVRSQPISCQNLADYFL